jgi:pimeloyl-ACP methyl ester carboxylesterase
MRRFGAALAVLLFCAMAWLRAQASVPARNVAPTSTFDVGILHIERFGHAGGRSIVLIPALFCGSWEWNAQIDALAPRYDVLAVTLPGFDGRPMVTGDALMARAARSLHALIASYHLRRPIVAGHSLGGTLAVYFGENYPGDASAIVTVEGGYPIAPTQAQRDARVAKSVAAYKNVSQSNVGAVIRKTTLQYTITSPADVAAAERLAARSDPVAIADWIRAALSLDLTPRLASITVPFTVIIPFDPNIDPYQGFKTEQQKRDAYTRWAAHAPDPKVIVIAPSRHFVMFDQPAQFERAFESAISRQGQSS